MVSVGPGKWYLSVTCQNPACAKGIAFGEPLVDPDGPQDLPPKLYLTCPHCKQAGAWEPGSVSKSQGIYRQ